MIEEGINQIDLHLFSSIFPIQDVNARLHKLFHEGGFFRLCEVHLCLRRLNKQTLSTAEIQMEVGVPTWNTGSRSYTFQILKCTTEFKTDTVYYEAGASMPAPVPPATTLVQEKIVSAFLEATRKYFTSPLTAEKVLRHLRHSVQEGDLPTSTGWYDVVWAPAKMIVKTGEYELVWRIASTTETNPMIPSEFTESKTPRPRSPDTPEQQEVRSIQIHDSLIPVGDLPLSDLPPLPFSTEEELDPLKEDSKRKIREARLKAALARLKAQRMEQSYYERYGQPPEESENSSETSSDSEDFPF